MTRWAATGRRGPNVPVPGMIVCSRRRPRSISCWRSEHTRIGIICRDAQRKQSVRRCARGETMVGSFRCRIPPGATTAWLRKNPWFESELVPYLRRCVTAALSSGPLVLAFVALTAACAPRLQQLGVEMRMPAIEQVQEDGVPVDRYVTRDGTKLGLTHWDAPMPRAVIVALHGMNDYSNAFAMPAPWWATRGISTYAYDQRGFGRSPQRGIWPGGDLMRRDLADFVDVMRRRHPNVPVFVLGESMGGAVAMSAFASDMPPRADGLILRRARRLGAACPFSIGWCCGPARTRFVAHRSPAPASR